MTATMATAAIWAAVRSNIDSPILAALLLATAAASLTALLAAHDDVSLRYLSEPSS